MNKAELVYTKEVAGTTYWRPSWWALDENGQAVSGPRSSRREAQMSLASVNRKVRSGEYAPRPLYTAY